MTMMAAKLNRARCMFVSLLIRLVPLFQRSDIGREIAGLLTRQRHVGHFRMRIEQEQGDPGGIEARPSCNRREGRRLIGRRAALGRLDDMARRSPTVSKADAVEDIVVNSGLR